MQRYIVEQGSSSNYKVGDATYETGSWNGDYNVFVGTSSPWFLRGGSFYNGGYAGVFCVISDYGFAYVDSGFRPVLVVGAAL